MGHSCSPLGVSDECIPGCQGGKYSWPPTGDCGKGECGRPDWCDPTKSYWYDEHDQWQWDTHFCPFRPHDLQLMLEQNEKWRAEPLTHCDQTKHYKCRYNETCVLVTVSSYTSSADPKP
eukprot:2930904-Pleurochrysis_carterae.AAC.1